MPARELKAHLQAQEAAMLERLAALVAHESPSGDKPALDALARRLAARLGELGALVSVIANEEGGDHVRARWPAADAADARPPVLVLGHFDTVWPCGTLAAMPFHVDQGRAYGPGSFDMKAGLVLLEFAIEAIHALGCPLGRPIVVLWTSDEEIGSPGSRLLIEAEARRAAYVLVLEPPLSGGALKTARKGVGRFQLFVDGKPAHAGVEPEKGVSAVLELAHQVLRLQALGNPTAGTTINIGVVRGGTVANVVAAQAAADIDVRAATRDDALRIETALRAIAPVVPGAHVRMAGGFNRPPMERSPGSAALFGQVRTIGKELNLDLGEGSTGGGSDGNFTAALGVPTLDGMGALGAGAHAVDEHVLVTPLAERAALLAEALLGLETA
jgi:glutamate carboxypeptidase